MTKLEEAANEHQLKWEKNELDIASAYESFIAGALWQAEQAKVLEDFVARFALEVDCQTNNRVGMRVDSWALIAEAAIEKYRKSK